MLPHNTLHPVSTHVIDCKEIAFISRLRKEKSWIHFYELEELKLGLVYKSIMTDE
jgi:hypothetical protein